MKSRHFIEKMNWLLVVLILSTTISAQEKVRVEHDLIGEKEIPADAYYGIQTVRAMENFHISRLNIDFYPELIKGFAIVKMAAARANNENGVLNDQITKGIDRACEALLRGEYHDQFSIDLVQGGAGTSTNMAANEIIANIALEKMGYKLGEYKYCDPHDHVNLAQSTNDTYPTALKVAFMMMNEQLIEELGVLAESFRRKGNEFNDYLKMGRTQLQDAVPMTVGQEFNAFAAGVETEIEHLKEAEKVLYKVNMGGTAIGTGLNTSEGYAQKCAKHLAEITGKDFELAPDLIAATSDLHAFVVYSGALKALAVKLSKICNDLRLLSSGPRAGLYEINLPAVQPGSSIMPGKVNPVIPEVVNQVCFRAIGNDVTVTMAAEAGQLQLNAFEPVIAYATLESQYMFLNASKTLRTLCVDGITVNKKTLKHNMETTIGIVTALNPIIGYERATELAHEAMETGKGIIELVREKKILTEKEIEELMDPAKMTGQKK